MHLLHTMSKGSFNYASFIKPVWLKPAVGTFSESIILFWRSSLKKFGNVSSFYFWIMLLLIYLLYVTLIKVIHVRIYLFIVVKGWFGCIFTQSPWVLRVIFFLNTINIPGLFLLTPAAQIFFSFFRPCWSRRMCEGSGPAPSLVRWDCSTDNGVTSSLPSRWGGGGPQSDLWSGKTDELLLPPRFFARSILHVGLLFMNDGDLLKSSIQLPKDTALAPIVPTRQE